ncbi:hypothetical protein DFA_02869 [Cavenderia fasciculata]|uniref:Uncharacterized protein n=1 Tax=Cavenderia fasciculata TaxID=261658 RepID=F4PIP6_CACFS|nr:uncharacterized protein DFA_02869 [Cavenderia fasciculata]EGG24625.1 hypothetical protein DFA_02869 [Cavenderia fasciculata]|eukprot:XP_004362476.1 hypothetical protein DFA_02869 [Cavenderia fasciculata]
MQNCASKNNLQFLNQHTKVDSNGIVRITQQQ